uniref:Uncharacterized protein n=1 Tax=Arundo donax TaxID=35708 RepID=A0A0A9GGM2_ARUDO
MTLSFEDCPDSSELSMKHELRQDNIEILDISDDNQAGKDSASELSSSEELILLQENAISAQTLLGSSNILEDGLLNGAVRNGNAAGTTCMQTTLVKQDEASCKKSREINLNSSEEHPPFAHVSDSDEDIVLDSLGDAHEGTASSVTDGVILSPELSAAYETNGALLREHDALPNDSHDDATDSAVSEADILSESNGVLQTNQISLQEHDASPGSVLSDDVQIIDGQLSSATSANKMDGFNSGANGTEIEITAKTVEPSEMHRLHDELEQSLLDASHDEQENSEGFVSHAALDTKTEDKHNEFKKSTSGITKEEVEASDASHEQEMSSTTMISRRTLKAQQKKEDNLFWLVLRAFVIAVSKLWTTK